MTKFQILQSPLIDPIRQQYSDQGKDFNSALDIALERVKGITHDEALIIELVINELSKMLDEKPAKTTGGKILRFLLHLFTRKS